MITAIRNFVQSLLGAPRSTDYRYPMEETSEEIEARNWDAYQKQKREDEDQEIVAKYGHLHLAGDYEVCPECPKCEICKEVGIVGDWPFCRECDIKDQARQDEDYQNLQDWKAEEAAERGDHYEDDREYIDIAALEPEDEPFEDVA